MYCNKQLEKYLQKPEIIDEELSEEESILMKILQAA
jgi:hypothetical protein